MHTNACLLYAYPGSVRAVIYFIPRDSPCLLHLSPGSFSMHRLRGSERILLIYLLYLLQCVFISMQVRKKGPMWLSLASLLISLYSNDMSTEGHGIGSPRPHIVPGVRVDFILLSYSSRLGGDEGVRSMHLLEGSSTSLLALPLVLLWVWLILLFQEKNGSEACLFFLVFFLSRLARGYDTDTFASICT